MSAQTRLVRSELLHLHGPDAAAFAHAQFMNDSRELSDGDGQWSGWLTPKGRLVAFFALIRLAADEFLLWLPDGGGDALRERLQRFVFRSKLSLTVRHDLQAVADFYPADHAQSLPIDAPAHALARFDPDPTNNAHPRNLLITGPGHDSPVDDALVARWQLADLALGVPYIAAGSAASEQFVPQWLSLERLEAYSVKKGCYPGQEIVARMHFLGQSKRAAFKLAGSGTPPSPLDHVVAEDGSAVGDVVWSTRSEAGWAALAVMAADRADAVLSIDGDSRPLRRLPD